MSEIFDQDERIEFGSDLAFQNFEPHICRKTGRFTQGYIGGYKTVRAALEALGFPDNEIEDSINFGADCVEDLVVTEREIALREQQETYDQT